MTMMYQYKAIAATSSTKTLYLNEEEVATVTATITNSSFNDNIAET